MVQFSCLVSLRILQPWHNFSTTHLAFIPSQCPRANLWTPLIITCSLSWQLGDLHAKRTNPVSYQKETHHLREYQCLLYWFWSNLPNPLHLLDNFLEVPKLSTPSNLCAYQIGYTFDLNSPQANKIILPLIFQQHQTSTKFEKHQLLTYLLPILFTTDYLDWLPLLHVNSTVYVNSTRTPKLQSMALIPLLGNWASSQDHSKQFIKQQINKKIKWRIHQSHNTRFTWKTPNPEKNHGRCHKTTREKYSLCGKLLQPLSEIIFSHPSPKYIILRNTP